MEKKTSETSFGTIKPGRRLSTRSSPGLQLSSRPSRSSTGETAARRRKPTHATIREHRRHRSASPFEVAVNLVMKVRPTDDEKFEIEPLELRLNNDNLLQKKNAAARRKSSAVPPRAFFGAVEPGYQSDYETGDDSVFFTPLTSANASIYHSAGSQPSSKGQQKQQAVVATAQKAGLSKSLDSSTPAGNSGQAFKKGAFLTGEQHKNSLRPFLRSLDCPHLRRRSSSNISVANTATSSKSTESRSSAKSGSSRRSSKDLQKKANQTTGGRYKDKKSLLRFASLQKPRSKSVGGNPPGFQLYPRPRRLSFNDSAAPDETINSVGAGYSLMDNTFYQTLDSIVQPTRLNFDESIGPAEKSRVSLLSVSSSSINSMNSTQNATFDFANTMNRTQLLNASVDQSMGPNGETKNVSNAILPTVASPSPGQSPLAFVAVVPRNVSFQVPPNAAIPSLSASFNSTASKNLLDSTASFSNVAQQAVACDVCVNDQKNQGFLHQRSMRLGFIADGVPMAVNLTLNFRSEGEKLYVEPIELLYEGQKMWRRSARQVIKEIKAQLAADKKKADALKKGAPAARKSILKTSSVAENDNNQKKKSPKEKSPRGKAGVGTSPKRYY